MIYVTGPLGALVFDDRPEVYCKESLETTISVEFTIWSIYCTVSTIPVIQVSYKVKISHDR